MAVPQEYTETLKLLAAGARVTVGKFSWKMTGDVCDTPACGNGGVMIVDLRAVVGI